MQYFKFNIKSQIDLYIVTRNRVIGYQLQNSFFVVETNAKHTPKKEQGTKELGTLLDNVSEKKKNGRASGVNNGKQTPKGLS